MYQLTFHKAVRKDIRKLERQLSAQLQTAHLVKIKQDPYQAEPLSYDLKGLWSYHFSYRGTPYRIVYEIYPAERLVLVIMIGPREGFYEALRQRVH